MSATSAKTAIVVTTKAMSAIECSWMRCGFLGLHEQTRRCHRFDQR
ncbi:hypothetical protein [Streptomyces brevispora]|uniref:Uncharacterized protein n=1 Tax=Streptomyces brevispora TaxID=887462 RepID=A0ABZ1FYY5_9ACTN|nr:hypothetical protein [Streptomyces brevispora]WSC12833.1 hypothetical protein OIE64_08275 [Streptomyces brevispora]